MGTYVCNVCLLHECLFPMYLRFNIEIEMSQKSSFTLIFDSKTRFGPLSHATAIIWKLNTIPSKKIYTRLKSKVFSFNLLYMFPGPFV